ncbi:MAG: hypothetical protein ABIV50_09780 [Opitutus sp.]
MSKLPNGGKDRRESVPSRRAQALVEVELLERIQARCHELCGRGTAEEVGEQTDQTANDVRVSVGPKEAPSVTDIADHPNA